MTLIVLPVCTSTCDEFQSKLFGEMTHQAALCGSKVPISRKWFSLVVIMKIHRSEVSSNPLSVFNWEYRIFMYNTIDFWKNGTFWFIVWKTYPTIYSIGQNIRNFKKKSHWVSVVRDLTHCSLLTSTILEGLTENLKKYIMGQFNFSHW